MGEEGLDELAARIADAYAELEADVSTPAIRFEAASPVAPDSASHRRFIAALLLLIAGAGATIGLGLAIGQDDDSPQVVQPEPSASSSTELTPPSTTTAPPVVRVVNAEPTVVQAPSVAKDEFSINGRWLVVPWHDSFLMVQVVGGGTEVAPNLEEWEELFPAEVVELFADDPPETLEEAQIRLGRAGLDDVVAQFLAENPGVSRDIFEGESLSVRLEAHELATDGRWVPVEVGEFPVVVATADQITSSGETLVLSGSVPDGDGPAVFSTSDLATWEATAVEVGPLELFEGAVIDRWQLDGLVASEDAWAGIVTGSAFLDLYLPVFQAAGVSGGGISVGADGVEVTPRKPIPEGAQPPYQTEPDEGNKVLVTWEELPFTRDEFLQAQSGSLRATAGAPYASDKVSASVEQQESLVVQLVATENAFAAIDHEPSASVTWSGGGKTFERVEDLPLVVGDPSAEGDDELPEFLSAAGDSALVATSRGRLFKGRGDGSGWVEIIPPEDIVENRITGDLQYGSDVWVFARGGSLSDSAALRDRWIAATDDGYTWITVDVRDENLDAPGEDAWCCGPNAIRNGTKLLVQDEDGWKLYEIPDTGPGAAGVHASAGDVPKLVPSGAVDLEVVEGASGFEGVAGAAVWVFADPALPGVPAMAATVVPSGHRWDDSSAEQDTRDEPEVFVSSESVATHLDGPLDDPGSFVAEGLVLLTHVVEPPREQARYADICFTDDDGPQLLRATDEGRFGLWDRLRRELTGASVGVGPDSSFGGVVEVRGGTGLAIRDRLMCVEEGRLFELKLSGDVGRDEAAFVENQLVEASPEEWDRARERSGKGADSLCPY